MTSTSSLGSKILALFTPQPASSIGIILDSDPVLLLGFTTSASSTLLRGRAVLELLEPTRIQEVLVRFRGRASVPSVSESLGDADHKSYDVCLKSWSVFRATAAGDLLQAGTYTYPFNTFIGGSLPASTVESATSGSYVTYTLQATAVRSQQRSNLHRMITVPVLRFLPCDSLAFFQSLDHEATIPGQLSYTMSLPHKAWAAGDTLSAIFRATIYTRNVSIRAVETCITQTRRMLRCGDWELQVEAIARGLRMMHRSSAEHLEREISLILDLAIPCSASPSHSVAPIYVEHHAEWTITVVDASGRAQDHHCRLPLHILDRQLLRETVAATLATRLKAFSAGSGSPNGTVELPEVHTPPRYQAHVHDRIPRSQVLPDGTAAMQGTAPSYSATPSYEVAVRGSPSSLPPLELLQQLPSYAGGSEPRLAGLASELAVIRVAAEMEIVGVIYQARRRRIAIAGRMNTAPSPPSGALCARASVTISAPVNKVWETLLDFPSYKEWDPFIRSQVLVDASGAPLSSQIPVEGVRIAQEIHLPSLSSSNADPSVNHSVEVLTHVNPRTHTLAWRLSSPAHWLFWSERWHVVRTLKRGAKAEGETTAVDFWRGSERVNWRGEETVYETWEVLGGMLAPAASWFILARLQRGLEESAYALKARLEKPKEWSWG
ncbi:unnamed protein product [Peniophora sp. CBMAI 1063]|nr:unnamed protein product [Peniophora sp. CBMAI 1063]